MAKPQGQTLPRGPHPLRPPPERMARQRNRSLLFRAFTVLLVLAVVAAAYLLWPFPDTDDERADPNAPISILPRQPDGITIAIKQPAAENLTAQLIAPPVAEGLDQARGYAVDLGSALSFAELSTRFAEIAANNAEAGLDQLEPRATLSDTVNGLEARLLVGPFASGEEALEACARIALPAGIECKAVEFRGELIARE
ncbi:MAG: SPOR domain-containing protein [Rhizobiaceae bacterium]